MRAPRQIAFYLLMVSATVGAVEIGARLIALVTLPGQTIRDVSEGRRRLIARAADQAPAYRFESDIQGFENEVLHPYLGFVFDPGANAREERRQNGMLEITPLGFFRQPGEQPSYAGATTPA